MSAQQGLLPEGASGLTGKLLLILGLCSAFLVGRFTAPWGHSSSGSGTTVQALEGHGSLRNPLASGDSAGQGGDSSGTLSSTQQHIEWHNAGPFYSGRGAYVAPGQEHMVQLASKDHVQVTDKITKHTYHSLYSALWDMAPGRPRVHRMLEIGLGCNMYVGNSGKVDVTAAAVGASARLWRRYFPKSTEVWFAEYNAECIKMRQQELAHLGIKAVTGDQEDPATLDRWVEETGGDFDVIIDDGGHMNAQQWQSFINLFPKALRPGGVYIIEDINASHRLGCDPKNARCEVVVDMILAWIDQIIMRDCNKIWKLKPELRPAKKYLMPPGIRMIQCSAEVCAIYKCYENDLTCYYPGCVNMELAANTPWNATIYPKPEAAAKP